MPRRKFATDEERVKATRDYHKRYYENNKAVLVERSKKWREDRRAQRPQAPVAE